MRGSRRLVLRVWMRPVGNDRVPLRSEPGSMSVGVLNDEAYDLFRRLHGDVKAHRRAEEELRRFWAADHRWRWASTVVGTGVIVLVLALMAGDVADLAG